MSDNLGLPDSLGLGDLLVLRDKFAHRIFLGHASEKELIQFNILCASLNRALNVPIGLVCKVDLTTEVETSTVKEKEKKKPGKESIADLLSSVSEKMVKDKEEGVDEPCCRLEWDEGEEEDFWNTSSR